MPYSHITLSPDAIDQDHLPHFIHAVNLAAMRAESVPDTPEGRRRSLVVLHHATAGSILWGGDILDAHLRAILVDFTCSRGILDGARKERLVADIQAAAESASDTADGRAVFTSVIIHEVAEGDWGRAGSVRRLPEMARDAGFEHLAGIAST